MSKPRARTVALVTAGVLALGGGATAVTLAQADPTTSPSPTTPSGSPSAASSGAPDPGRGPGGGHGRGGFGHADGELVTQLASKLGLSEDKVRTALQAAQQELRPTKPSAGSSPSAGSTPAKPDPTARDTALAKALATKLGVDEAKVTTALNEIRTAREAERTEAFDDRLAQAVKDGKITAADADAVKKAAAAGVIGMGGR